MDNTQNPNMPPSAPVSGPDMGGTGNQSEEKSTGVLIGSIIIIIILVVGGLYLWSSKMQSDPLLEETMPELMPDSGAEDTTEQDAMTEALKAQKSSDEVPDIEKDLSNTNLGANLDTELQAI